MRCGGSWERQIGAAEVERREQSLTALVGTVPEHFDMPGWIAERVSESD